jgi:hypothetical protein
MLCTPNKFILFFFSTKTLGVHLPKLFHTQPNPPQLTSVSTTCPHAKPLDPRSPHTNLLPPPQTSRVTPIPRVLQISNSTARRSRWTPFTFRPKHSVRCQTSHAWSTCRPLSRATQQPYARPPVHPIFCCPTYQPVLPSTC